MCQQLSFHKFIHTCSPLDMTETSASELSSLDRCLAVIVDSLTQKNPVMVKAVRDLVSELCRITLLWDEMWLAALMQRQGEVHRRLLQIEAETKRTFAIHNQLLSMERKEAVMRQKYVATMKPVSHVCVCCHVFWVCVCVWLVGCVFDSVYQLWLSYG